MKEIRTMLKLIGLGLISLTAACAGAALANGQPNPNFWIQSWNQGSTFNPPGNQSVFANEWQLVVNDPQLPAQLRNLCASNPKQCDQWEDWAKSVGIWQPPPSQTPQPAPEIDPAGVMGALTILATVLAMVRGRRPVSKPA
jgi:hypothetical protein